MNIELNVVLPERSDDALSDFLRELTRRIDEKYPELVGHGFLGGEHGYGAEFSNDVFEMRTYYWGDCTCGYEEREWRWCEDNHHSQECYQSERDRRFTAAKLLPRQWEGGLDWPHEARRREEGKILEKLCEERGFPYPAGCAVHCDCGHDAAYQKWLSENAHEHDCPIVLPNFRHKPSGFEVVWYKWIGRDNETTGSVNLGAMARECFASLED